MMKHNIYLSILFFVFSTNIHAFEIRTEYSEPPNACYSGCTEYMSTTLDLFQKAEGLQLTPAVYSGECRHLSSFYNPETTHYAVMMIDQHPDQSRMYFSTIFSFFAPENEFSGWNLETSRQEMSPYWLEHGNLKKSETSPTQRVVVNYESGDPAYHYFMRQDPVTKEVYYITFAGIETISFCRLQPN